MCAPLDCTDCNCCGIAAVNYWSKRLNCSQGLLWLRRGGQQHRQSEGWKIVSAIWGPRERAGDAARRERGSGTKKRGPNGVQSLRVRGPYGSRDFALRFIAHLAVLINGESLFTEPRAAALVSSLSHFHSCRSTTPRHFFTKPPKSCAEPDECSPRRTVHITSQVKAPICTNDFIRLLPALL